MVSLMADMVRRTRREHIRGTPRRAAPMTHDEGPAGRGRDAVRHLPDARQPAGRRVAGLAGFDWLLVDLEHGGGDESLLLGQLLGATAAGVHALVRVESDVRGRTARALDLGVEGVMCPQVNSAEAAAAWAARAALRQRAAGSRCSTAARGSAPTRTRSRTRASGSSGSPRSSRRRRSRPSSRSPPSTASTCCSSARATCRSRWGCSVEFDDPGVPRRRSSASIAAARDAGKTTGIFLTSPDQVPARGRGRVPDDRPRLRRRLHDAGRRARSSKLVSARCAAG